MDTSPDLLPPGTTMVAASVPLVGRPGGRWEVTDDASVTCSVRTSEGITYRWLACQEGVHLSTGTPAGLVRVEASEQDLARVADAFMNFCWSVEDSLAGVPVPVA